MGSVVTDRAGPRALRASSSEQPARQARMPNGLLNEMRGRPRDRVRGSRGHA